MLKIGERLKIGTERYEVLEQLGSGGFAAVFKLQRIEPARPKLVVAVKQLQPLHALDAGIVARFDREARILGNINHPNVIKMLQRWRLKSGELLLVEEFVDGDDLCSHLARVVERKASLFLQILYGLRAIHANAPGAVHRDLSPSNILVTSEHQIKLIDFGLSKEVARATPPLTTNITMGTAGCVAPEQHSDAKNVDGRADLYSLGKTYAAALQNRLPSHADISILKEPWRTLCGKLTEYERGNRYQTAEDTILVALNLFTELGTTPGSAHFHFQEFKTWNPVPRQWISMAKRYFLRNEALIQTHFALAEMVTPEMLAAPLFEVDRIYMSLDRGPIEYVFGGGDAIFSLCDELGDFLTTWFPHLSGAARDKCFERLCGTAVQYHRYPLMSAVRLIFAQSKDSSLRARLLEILNRVDVDKTIESRGIIPR